MSDLIKRLRGLAERDTAMSEFGPDEHIAGIAADHIETLEASMTSSEVVVRLKRENDELKAKLDAVELENKVLRNEESYEEWLTYVRSKTQEQDDEV